MELERGHVVPVLVLVLGWRRWRVVRVLVGYHYSDLNRHRRRSLRPLCCLSVSIQAICCVGLSHLKYFD